MGILSQEILEKPHYKNNGIFIAHDNREKELADENLY
jgi:hypothetical protein